MPAGHASSSYRRLSVPGLLESSTRGAVCLLWRHDNRLHVGVVAPETRSECLDGGGAEASSDSTLLTDQVVDAGSIPKRQSATGDGAVPVRVGAQAITLNDAEILAGVDDYEDLRWLMSVDAGKVLLTNRLEVDWISPPFSDMRGIQPPHQLWQVRFAEWSELQVHQRNILPDQGSPVAPTDHPIEEAFRRGRSARQEWVQVQAPVG